MVIRNINKKNVQLPQEFYQKLVRGLLNDNRFAFNIQTRGFKTDRSIKAELERNPSLVSRLKNNLGTTSETSSKIPLGSLTSDSDQLKKLLAAENGSISDGEKQRVKVAFAEGYLVGNTNASKSGKGARYFRVIQQVLTIAIFLAIVISLMASASGSMFRYDFMTYYLLNFSD